MNALIVAMMTWISAVTGLPVPNEFPKIEFVEPAKIASIANPGETYDPAISTRYLGLYDNLSGTILLFDDWDRDNLKDRSILVHELVHHMQMHSGETYRCNGEREKLAYDVQEQWLAERGADIYELLEMNSLFVYVVTRCPPDLGMGEPY